MADKKNIFVLGLNEFNRQFLQTVHGAENYNFHTLINNQIIEEPQEHMTVKQLLDMARSELSRFPGRIDAIIGYIDMPVSFMVPILCQEYGLPTASIESVLKCQHKYWSRLIQSQVIFDYIPDFNLVDPFRPNPSSQIYLKFSYWLKPVKSAGSYLAFHIHNKKELNQRLSTIRDNIRRLSDPFNDILELALLPHEVRTIDFTHCIAEQVISGRQCTLEGYVYQGKVHIYGVVDSVRFPHISTFSRYEYPSKIPKRVTDRMADITRTFFEKVQFDNSTFNVEFFWNESRDQIWLIEFNTRMSQSHSYLFSMVDGASNHEAMVDVGLGKSPSFPHREGPYKYAAKFFYRMFRDAIVSKAPTLQEIHEIQRKIPGSLICLNVEKGTRLSELLEQDSYSYDVAWIFVAGKTRQELHKKYQQCAELLDIRFAPVESPRVLQKAQPPTHTHLRH